MVWSLRPFFYFYFSKWKCAICVYLYIDMPLVPRYLSQCYRHFIPYRFLFLINHWNHSLALGFLMLLQVSEWMQSVTATECACLAEFFFSFSFFLHFFCVYGQALTLSGMLCDWLGVTHIHLTRETEKPLWLNVILWYFLLFQSTQSRSSCTQI